MRSSKAQAQLRGNAVPLAGALTSISDRFRIVSKLCSLHAGRTSWRRFAVPLIVMLLVSDLAGADALKHPHDLVRDFSRGESQSRGDEAEFQHV